MLPNTRSRLKARELCRRSSIALVDVSEGLAQRPDWVPQSSSARDGSICYPRGSEEPRRVGTVSHATRGSADRQHGCHSWKNEVLCESNSNFVERSLSSTNVERHERRMEAIEAVCALVERVPQVESSIVVLSEPVVRQQAHCSGSKPWSEKLCKVRSRGRVRGKCALQPVSQRLKPLAVPNASLFARSFTA